MNQIQLYHNTTTVNFLHPNGGTVSIPPGEALYDPVTGYIHILKSSDPNDPMLLQLFPIKKTQHEKNRAIARVASALVSVLGIDFVENDNVNELVDFVFDESVSFSLNNIADVISNMTAETIGLGYYDMKTKELVWNFPIQIR
ncbi:MAG: hypothetical protein F6K41_06825 [Symploca sp. SIO3E6]|nr:hypothetical protein [Caldora sp. SIO3E6]